MSRVCGMSCRLVFWLCAVLMLTALVFAQDAPANSAVSTPHIGLPQDWSTGHVIYTRNGSVEDMMKVRDDPRFLHSFLLHKMREQGSQLPQPLENATDDATSTIVVPDPDAQAAPDRRTHRPPSKLKHRHSKVDWAVSLGTTSGMSLGENPAKYSFDPNAAPDCNNDYVVFTIQAGGRVGRQANLVALRNLYSGTPAGICGTAPTFLFSYAIGSGTSDLSPVLSLDGKKIAWLENRGTVAYLHVTTWVAGQGTNATTGAVAIGNCSPGASCDVAINYTSSAYPGCPTVSTRADSNSNLYVDYGHDAGFVSADNGLLYHVSGVFKGTPTVDFCIPVNTSAGLGMTGAVYDSKTNKVFISDSKTLYAFTVGPTSFTAAGSILYGGNAFSDSPILDSFNGYLYMFSSRDTTGNFTAVSQIPTTLASKIDVHIGPRNTHANAILIDGAFDENYFNFGPTDARSTLYTCGTDSTNTASQDLFTLNFLGTGLINTTPVMTQNKNINPGGANGLCSPLTDFFDGTRDRLFVGVGNWTDATGANVVQMWDITNRITSAVATPTAAASPYLGGTTGFTIDNASAQAQAASIYFSTLFANATTTTCGANNYCAVKLTQSGLK
ncbi:MAG: hypothetical protein LAO22_02800 [Acidobacteriia bacterium]|nr:hypothetical protein [Terriglobia bacterium]